MAMDGRLRIELLELAAADEAAFRSLEDACEESPSLKTAIAARSEPGSSSPAWPVEWTNDPPAVIREIQLTVAKNSERMWQIVRATGWPGQSLVGADGCAAAWLLVHHSGDLELQRTCLPLLERAVKDGDAPPSHLEWLTDRVSLREGRPEQYGTHAGTRGAPPYPPIL